MILIGIGANLPDSQGRPALETCRWAAMQLDRLPGIRLRALSRWFLTAPVPASDQPDYVNGVALVTGGDNPAALLSALHAIEHAAGRVRGAVNAARVLDLDLIAWDDEIVASPTLTLPHPRAALRAFVLAPLRDVAPDWRHPVLRETATILLQRSEPSIIKPLLADPMSIR